MKSGRVIWGAVSTLLVCAACAGPGPDAAPSPTSAVKTDLQSAALSELGARAAQRVAEATPAMRAQVTREVVVATFELQPTATVLVVGAIAKSHPTLAPEAVEAAVEQQPRQVLAIVAAALDAAPGEVAGVVRAASRQAPKHYKAISLLAGKLAPKAAEEILLGLAEGVPALKGLVERSRQDQLSAGMSVRVPQTVAQVDAWLTSAAKSMKATSAQLIASNDKRLTQYTPPPGAPTMGPPLTPSPNSPPLETPIGGGSTAPVPPGGRDYPNP